MAEHLTWFEEHLSNLSSNSSTVALKLHVTSQELPILDEKYTKVHTGLEKASKQMESTIADGTLPYLAEPAGAGDMENVNEKEPQRLSTVRAADFDGVRYGKFKADAAIQEAIEGLTNNHRVLVAACGPSSLMNAVLDAVEKCRKMDGPSLEVHCEQFGW